MGVAGLADAPASARGIPRSCGPRGASTSPCRSNGHARSRAPGTRQARPSLRQAVDGLTGGGYQKREEEDRGGDGGGRQ
eukprot:4538198-Pyramimonas_sp.AAC.1